MGSSVPLEPVVEILSPRRDKETSVNGVENEGKRSGYYT